MLLSEEEESDWWYKLFPKNRDYMLLEVAPLKDKVIYIRKLYSLILCSQIVILTMFLVLTSTKSSMESLTKEGQVLILLPMLGLLIIIFLYFMNENIQRDYAVLFLLGMSLIIGFTFSFISCFIILWQPIMKWSLLLFLVANIFYIFGLICLTFKEEWHNKMFLTYLLYSTISVWTILGLVILIFPTVNMHYLAYTVMWLLGYSVYICIDINLLIRGWRRNNLTINEYTYGAFLIQFDFMIFIIGFIVYIFRSFKECK